MTRLKCEMDHCLSFTGWMCLGIYMLHVYTHTHARRQACMHAHTHTHKHHTYIYGHTPHTHIFTTQGAVVMLINKEPPSPLSYSNSVWSLGKLCSLTTALGQNQSEQINETWLYVYDLTPPYVYDMHIAKRCPSFLPRVPVSYVCNL